VGTDEALLVWVNQGWGHPALDPLFTWVSTRLGFALPLLLALLVDARRRAGGRGARLWLALVLSVAIGDQVGNQLKDVFAEPRPCSVLAERLRAVGGEPTARCGATLTGMPSNHALNFTLATTFLARTTPWRAWQLGMTGATVAVALSRVYLGKHYPSQVLAGAVLGFWLGVLAAGLACYYGLGLRGGRR
jgi:undecaprenyl-diphosphatase